MTRQTTPKTKCLNDLSRSGLSAADFSKLKCEPLNEKQTARLTTYASTTSYRIPYFDVNGKQIKYYRLRFTDLPVSRSGEKPPRYWQPKGTVPCLYLPPFVVWKTIARDAEKTLYITEGEKKAARACRVGVPCIGLGGVWCWRAAKQGVTLIKDFDSFDFKGRKVVIVFDSDVQFKTDVQQALRSLGKELVQLGATPYTIKLPGVSEAEKIGLDDYLEQNSVEEFLRLPIEPLLGDLGVALWGLNTELAYIEESEGIYRFKTEQMIGRPALLGVSYANRQTTIVTPEGKVEKVSVALEWLKWPHRRTHTRITYAPGQPECTDENEYNIWPGWGVTPQKGDITLWAQLMEYFFRGSPQHQRWFLQWLAYPLQNPGTKMYTAVVLLSLTEGLGKSLIGITLGQIYGKNFSAINGSDLHDGYNYWAAGKQFVLGDDVTGSDRRNDADLLKVMVTRETITINKKYQPHYTVKDRVNYLFTTNQPDAFYMGQSDRRYFILEVSSDPLPDAFYKKYDRWLWSKEGPAALFHFLLNNVDCSEFNPKAHAPMTEAKEAMMEINQSEMDAWAITLAERPESICRVDNKVIKRIFWTTAELLSLYDPLGQKKSNITALGKSLRRAKFQKPKSTHLPDGRTVKLVTIYHRDQWDKADHSERSNQYLLERPTTKLEKISKF